MPAESIAITAYRSGSGYHRQFPRKIDNDKFIEERLFLPSYDQQTEWELITAEICVRKKERRLLKSIQGKTDLHQSLTHIYNTIREAEYILDLEDDWDDEGAVSISIDTFDKAINFIKEYSISLLENHKLILVAPTISPVGNGSIDVLWQTQDNSLLVNINNGNFAYYYGVLDVRNLKSDFNGKVPANTVIHFFAVWLEEYAMEGRADTRQRNTLQANTFSENKT